MEVKKGYSDRSFGSMYLSEDGPNEESVRNRGHFFDSIGLSGKVVVSAGPVHGIGTAFVHAEDPTYIPGTDALITREIGVALSVTGADCFPIYFEDSAAGVIGLAHAGWRGIVGGIIENVVSGMIAVGADPANVRLHVGPGICSRHFEIRADVLGYFSDYPDAISRVNHDGHTTYHVDLRHVIRYRSIAAGISDARVSESDECTFCLPDRYYSYRRDHPSALETQLAYIIMTG
ncbi:MAG: polyphenol oxidase family protein [Candidatus Moranbacteria bacterium]|nr:polyphenol oxidase family protein [Candidatus Moranbacteria bacterium]